jgi:uncharacterized protein YukE
MAKIQTRTGAHVNLSELLSFNEELIKFKRALDNYLIEINASVKELEKGWQDEKLDEYKTEFNKYTQILTPLGEELERSKKHMEENWIPKIKKHLEMKRNK